MFLKKKMPEYITDSIKIFSDDSDKTIYGENKIPIKKILINKIKQRKNYRMW